MGKFWWEFASKLFIHLTLSGATIDANLVKPYNSNVNSMADQMSTFLSTANTTAPWSSTNTLFSFFIGINDIGMSI